MELQSFLRYLTENPGQKGTRPNLTTNGSIEEDHQHGLVAAGSQLSASKSIIRRAGLNEAEYKKRDANYTRASVIMVVAFVVCNTGRFVPNIMEIFLDLECFPGVSSIYVSGLPYPHAAHCSIYRSG